MGMYSDWVARNSGKSDKQIVNIEWVLKMLDKLIPPVGSIYMSISAANPNSIYPGTSWVAWGSGRVPVGVDTNQSEFNNVEKTGGAKAHTLTVNEMPRHNHSYYSSDAGGSNSYRILDGMFSGSEIASSIILPTGGGQAHNNLQPYITCYMWKRTQ